MEEAKRASVLDPTFFFAPWGHGWIDIQAGKVRDAVPEFQKAKALEAPPFVTAWLGYAYGASGDRTHALDYLERAHAANSQWMIYLRGDRIFDPLRSEPRFVALMRKLRFEK
ncbi:MAG TPA: hypothetical protein VF554_08835 [Thermoanaerobaculia bacterium]|jgi:tetratricopeptide (TPR) repeat protein